MKIDTEKMSTEDAIKLLNALKEMGVIDETAGWTKNAFVNNKEIDWCKNYPGIRQGIYLIVDALTDNFDYRKNSRGMTCQYKRKSVPSKIAGKYKNICDDLLSVIKSYEDKEENGKND